MATDGLRRRVESLLPGDQSIVDWRRIDRGYTPADRRVASLSDGSSVFIKSATTPSTAEWLRAEHRIYANVTGYFMPRFIAWDDGNDGPVLIIEDLTDAHWPPPWRPGDVEAVLTTLRSLRANIPPEGLPPVEQSSIVGWPRVAADPGPFLSLGLCSRTWLERALPALVKAEGQARIEGEEFIHLDVRSDNICIRDGVALLVDWNHACLANGAFDIAAWLPSLHAEGGPRPSSILPAEPGFAALLSGYMAAQAGLPPPVGAPRVRDVQLQQLGTALPWAIEELGLVPLG